MIQRKGPATKQCSDIAQKREAPRWGGGFQEEIRRRIWKILHHLREIVWQDDHALGECPKLALQILVTASPPKGLTLTGTSQGSAHPETGSTVQFSTTPPGVSPEVSDVDFPPSPPAFR